MTDPNQTIINQLSLVLTIDQDLARACKKADLHPALTEELLKLHSSLKEMEKVINDQNKSMFVIAKTIDALVDGYSTLQTHVIEATKHGFDQSEVEAEDINGA